MSHQTLTKSNSSSKIALEEIYPVPIPLPPPPVTRKKKKPVLPPQHTVKSVDEKHNEIMSQFCDIEQKEIPEWKKQYRLLKKKIRYYVPEWDGKANLSILSLDSAKIEEKIYHWKEEMDAIKQQIKDYETRKKKYIIENADFIFKYFEDKKQISSSVSTAAAALQFKVEGAIDDSIFSLEKNEDNNADKKDKMGQKQQQESKNRKLLNDFFNIQKQKKNGNKMEFQEEKGGGSEISGMGGGGGAMGEKEKPSIQKRKMHTYWKNVCDEIPNLQDYALSSEICTYCCKGEYIINEEEGTYNCHNCGHFVLQYVNTPKHFNNEAPGEVTYTTYDRLIHFKEILSQFQAKETTKIPEEMVKNIANRIRKERIKDISEIDYDKMRDILRTLGYNHYFEHIQLINSIFGIEPPQMDKELYDTLCVLFMETRKPWALYCPPNRTNFFNYTYVLYQLCVLLGQHQYLPFIPMMKDPKKRLNMDVIWKQLCEHLDWEYIPSPH
jgi:hypothetical protein